MARSGTLNDISRYVHINSVFILTFELIVMLAHITFKGIQSRNPYTSLSGESAMN